MRNILKRIGYGIAAVKLGDQLSGALARVGITPERVTAFLGKECGCVERKEKMNKITEWIGKALAGDPEEAKKDMDQLIESYPPLPPHKRI